MHRRRADGFPWPRASRPDPAGFLEGYLTAREIEDNWHNMRTYFTSMLNASAEEPMKWCVRPRVHACACGGMRGLPCMDMARHVLAGLVGLAAAPPSRPNPGPCFQPEAPPAAMSAHRIQKQDVWVRTQCAGRTGGDRYWQAVCLGIRQFDGLKLGYRAAVAAGPQTLNGGMTDWDFLFMHSNGTGSIV